MSAIGFAWILLRFKFEKSVSYFCLDLLWPICRRVQNSTRKNGNQRMPLRSYTNSIPTHCRFH